MNEIPKIELYSDGGAEPNPGKGGYGCILCWNGQKKEFFQGFKMTTNNRMELMGVIKGLEQLKTKSEVQVYSDSKYVIDGIELGWARKWKANNWYRNKHEKAINADLWDRLLTLIDFHQVRFNWIRGHNGHPENERCDLLATQALNLDNLEEDHGYSHQVIEKSTTAETNHKILKEGDLCRKCNIPVIIKKPEHKKLKANQPYYFEYYLLCPQCKSKYMVEEAKRFTETKPNLFD